MPTKHFVQKCDGFQRYNMKTREKLFTTPQKCPLHVFLYYLEKKDVEQKNETRLGVHALKEIGAKG